MSLNYRNVNFVKVPEPKMSLKSNSKVDTFRKLKPMPFNLHG